MPSVCSWASARGERAFAPPLEIGTKNQKLVENLKSTDLIVAITVYLPV